MVKYGFTLIELVTAMAISGTLMVANSQMDSLENDEKKAAAYGKELFEYNAAVGRFISHHSANPDSITGTYNGSNWLHPTTCGGSAAMEFLSCTYMASDVTQNYGSMPTTEITKTPDEAIEARTVWTPVEGDNGNKTLVMGLASIAASGAYVSELEDPASATGPTIYCPNITSYSPTISAICGSDTDRIISLSNTNPSVEKWLRIDHSNTMKSAIEFDTGTGVVTPVTGAGLSLDDIDGSNLRQIVNVSRLYNLGSTNNDSIIIGRVDGEAIYTDSFLSGNGLLQDSAIIDGDIAILHDLYLKGNAIIEGDITSTGDIEAENISAHNDISAGNSIDAVNDITAGDDIFAGGNVEARDMMARGSIWADGAIRAKNYIHSDKNITTDEGFFAAEGVNVGTHVNAGTFVQAATNVVAGDSVFAQTGSVNAATHVAAGTFIQAEGLIYSKDNIYADNNIEARGSLISRGRIYADTTIEFSNSATVGASCSPNGLLATASDGGAVSCVGKKWVSLTSSGGITDLCTFSWPMPASNSLCKSECGGSAPGTWELFMEFNGDELRGASDRQGNGSKSVYSNNSTSILHKDRNLVICTKR